MGNSIWSSAVDSILSAGMSLESVGVRNWALSRDDALEALNRLEALGVGVLGVDVYRTSGQVLELSFDNWHCEKEPGEDNADFVARSADISRAHIVSWPDRDAFFALVPAFLS